jgi:transcriptional regulator with XRE-family HTH domain
VIDGEQIRTARQTAGLTQEELARHVGVSQRTVGNWERGDTVPRDREPQLRSVLRDHLGASDELPLRGVSDVELLAEVARRLARSEQRGEGDDSGDPAATIKPGQDPANVRKLTRAEESQVMQTEAANERRPDEE